MWQLKLLVIFPAMVTQGTRVKRNYEEKLISLGLEIELFPNPVTEE